MGLRCAAAAWWGASGHQSPVQRRLGPGAYHPVRGATDRHREHEYARELAGLFLASRRIDLQQLAVSIPNSYGRSLRLRPRMWLADALLGALFSSAPARRRLPRDRTP